MHAHVDFVYNCMMLRYEGLHKAELEVTIFLCMLLSSWLKLVSSVLLQCQAYYNIHYLQVNVGFRFVFNIYFYFWGERGGVGPQFLQGSSAKQNEYEGCA